MATPITERELMVLAAVFAVSNMGQRKPDRRTVEAMLAAKSMTLSSAVNWTAQQHMETDEHERIFAEEGAMWSRDLRGKSREYVAATWPDIAALVWTSP